MKNTRFILWIPLHLDLFLWNFAHWKLINWIYKKKVWTNFWFEDRLFPIHRIIIPLFWLLSVRHIFASHLFGMNMLILVFSLWRIFIESTHWINSLTLWFFTSIFIEIKSNWMSNAMKNIKFSMQKNCPLFIWHTQSLKHRCENESNNTIQSCLSLQKLQ